MVVPKSAKLVLLTGLFTAAALATLLRAEPRFVDLQVELAAASAVAEVTILEYMDNKLWVQSFTDPFIRVEASYSEDPAWNPKRFIDSNWINEQERTAIWPPVGAKVLIAIDAAGRVSLFAQPVLGGYRFWSPRMTGSTAMFECAPPAEALQPVNSKDAYYKNKSWEGCLLPASAIPWKELGHLAPASLIRRSNMKGWEVYSWPEGGQWYFSLLTGTNRLKSAEEITHAKVDGAGKLIQRLKGLADGERVFWQSPKPRNPELGFLERPPKEAADEVLRACLELRLNCEGLSY